VGPELMGMCLAAFFSVLGHNYSVLLKFDGGRGAATLMGIILFLDWPMFFVWLGSVLLFMFIVELIKPGKAKKSLFRRAVSDQIIGRLIGEVVALIPFYILGSLAFWPTLVATPLVLIRHIDRIKKQVKDYK
jgi:glycerol-3-phosphate acyltransferase PlsY